jgi:hypothetical protein
MPLSTAEDLIQRAGELDHQAITDDAACRLGPPPTHPDARAQWEEAATLVAAYSERHRVIALTPLGPQGLGRVTRIRPSRLGWAGRPEPTRALVRPGRPLSPGTCLTQDLSAGSHRLLVQYDRASLEATLARLRAVHIESRSGTHC